MDENSIDYYFLFLLSSNKKKKINFLKIKTLKKKEKIIKNK